MNRSNEALKNRTSVQINATLSLVAMGIVSFIQCLKEANRTYAKLLEPESKP
jgi:hypothetical protein